MWQCDSKRVVWLIDLIGSLADCLSMDRKLQEQADFDLVAANWNAPRALVRAAMTDALHKNFSHYTGVYIYLLEGDLLVLSNFRGRATEHTRIPIGEGICGRAAGSRKQSLSMT